MFFVTEGGKPYAGNAQITGDIKVGSRTTGGTTGGKSLTYGRWDLYIGHQGDPHATRFKARKMYSQRETDGGETGRALSFVRRVSALTVPPDSRGLSSFPSCLQRKFSGAGVQHGGRGGITSANPGSATTAARQERQHRSSQEVAGSIARLPMPR